MNFRRQEEQKGQAKLLNHKGNTVGSDNEDANDHIEKVLEIIDLFHIPEVTQVQIMLQAFLMSLTEAASRWLRNELAGLDVPTRQILDSKGVISSMKAGDAKKAIQEMADHSKKWHNGTSTRARSTDTSDGLAAIQAQLNNLGNEIKKVKAFEKAFYMQYRVPFPLGGRFRATTSGFCQRDNGNSSYQERRQTMEESLNKFMVKSAKRHDKNSILIKEIRSSTDVAIRNQGASIIALEIQIGEMSKVLQERGSGSLFGSTETNPRDHVKSISTTIKTDTTLIRRIRETRYAILDNQNRTQTFKPNQSTIPFPSQLANDYYDEMNVLDFGTYGVIEERREMEDEVAGVTYKDSLPQKEKDPWSFTLPCLLEIRKVSVTTNIALVSS
ncbi:hypothetical protein Tco_0367590 [Tanacetum coccineum]